VFITKALNLSSLFKKGQNNPESDLSTSVKLRELVAVNTQLSGLARGALLCRWQSGLHCYFTPGFAGSIDGVSGSSIKAG
jgi:hypothetical protein